MCIQSLRSDAYTPFMRIPGAGKSATRGAVKHATPKRSASKRIGGRTLNDYYAQEAKKRGYLSRAAFKLQHIDDKCSVIKKNSNVLDLGCYPGAWLQVVSQRLGNDGKVVGIDLKELPKTPTYCNERTVILHGDARELSRAALVEHTAGYGFDAVLSDMCHDTMGASFADVALSLELCECAAKIAVGQRFCMSEAEYGQLPARDAEALRSWQTGVLRQNGSLVMKILEGEGTTDFVSSLKPFFVKTRRVRPTATRKESREVYIVCIGLK